MTEEENRELRERIYAVINLLYSTVEDLRDGDFKNAEALVRNALQRAQNVKLKLSLAQAKKH